MPGRGWGIALLLAAVLAGCGSGGHAPAGLTPGQAQALTAELESARAAAGAHDVAATAAALRRFRASVASLERSGQLSAPAARLLRLGAARVLARVQSDNPAPAPTPVQTQTTPAPAPTPPPEPPGQAKKHPKPPKDHKPGKDHGKGPGDGGDGGGD